MVKRYITATTLISLLILAGYLFSHKAFKKNILYREKRILLGTFVEVISPDKKAIEISFDEIKRIEGLLSKYNPKSDISILNKEGLILASPEAFYIIEKAKEFYSLSEGAFDITIGPLVDLWGFTKKEYLIPSQKEIEKTLPLIGSDKIILRKKDNMIQFKLQGMKVDLGAIAKGFALDCAVKRLKEERIKDALINAGGQVYCLGTKFNKPWRVAIKGILKKEGFLYLQDRAVSTSGNYEQFFKYGEKVYGHIIDPKTGYPKIPDFFSVTVITDDSITADFLSTAIFLLGEEKGLALAKKFKDTEVKIIRR
ncbi:MAG: FAD:protein FMN transferase [Candidatus Omnitrophota bacterium]